MQFDSTNKIHTDENQKSVTSRYVNASAWMHARTYAHIHTHAQIDGELLLNYTCLTASG